MSINKTFFKNKYFISGLVVILLLAVGGYYFLIIKKESINPSTSSNTAQNTAPKPELNKSLYSIDDPSSIWLIVNKHRALPDGYQPSDLALPKMSLRPEIPSLQLN